MKAVRIHEYGHSDRIEVEDVTSPTNKPDEVLVRIHAAGINPIDWKIREGAVQRTLPLTLGQDFSGEVIAVGANVTGFAAGDRVYGFASGAYAEIAAVSPELIAKRPTTIDDAVAASLPTPGLTALQCVRIAGVMYGQYILVHGAAGSVGSIATQLCVEAGAHVFANASGTDAEYVRGLGARKLIDYHVQRFEDVVRNVDAVIDTVGHETAERSFLAIKHGGVIVSTVGPLDAALARDAGVVAIRMMMQKNANDLRELARLVDSGAVKPPRVGRIMPLVAAREAQDLYESGRADKVVLDVG